MDIKEITERLRANSENFRTHNEMFQIYEGNLNHYLDRWLSDQIDGNSIRYAKVRKCPINLLRKIVDKLSQIYQTQPTRVAVNGNATDDALMVYYEDKMKINRVMNIANEFFNMSRATLIQPYIHKGLPKLRAIPNDRFMVLSNDPVDPLNVTHTIVCQGTEKIDARGLQKQIFHLYTDQEFIIFDSSGAVRDDLMRREMNEDGENPFGIIPFVYINRSSNLLSPEPDLELMQMVILVAGLLTDLNFASMFSLFSIMYGIDVTDEQLALSPNAFWNLKSDPSSDKKPEIGTIKNEADVTQTLELVKSQLSMFLNSRSIKTSAIGDLDTSNFSSGIAKLLDESDTFEERQRQIGYFKQAEDDLWNLITKHLHPVWSQAGLTETRLQFSANMYVQTEFFTPSPMQKRGDLVRDLKMEMDAGFTTLGRAIAALNPDMSQDEINEIIKENEVQEIIVQPQEQQVIINDEVDLGTTESEDTNT